MVFFIVYGGIVELGIYDGKLIIVFVVGFCLINGELFIIIDICDFFNLEMNFVCVGVNFYVELF